jgi:hypothetical protein
MIRLVFVLLGLTLLSACTGLETGKPLLTAADERGAPALRPGVWVVVIKPDCKLDERKPMDQWPDCAGGLVVRRGELRLLAEKKPKDAWERISFIFAAGDPRIAQIGGKSKRVVGQDAVESYDYGVAGPLQADAKGRIVAVTFWTVLCGPPPPAGASPADIVSGTLAPLPGLKTQPGVSHCSTDSVETLRGAAKASLAWKDEPIVAHWVRDGDR